MTPPATCAIHPDNDPFCHSPKYLAADGLTGYDCFSLAGANPQFSLSKLARFLTAPVLFNEFIPDCPWLGVTRLRPAWNWPAQNSNLSDLSPAFEASVSECIGDASTVAVLFSGGLDSTAVLLYADRLCRREGRRLIAITADLISDHGVHIAETARHLAEDLEVVCEFRAADNCFDPTRPFPPWIPVGPRLDAMPRLNRAMSEHAQEMGAEVLLTGSGADELLGAGRFLLLSLLRFGKPARAWRYLQYVAEGGLRSFALEALGLASSCIPRRLGAQLYWGINWLELLQAESSPILAEPYRSLASQWAEGWLRNSMHEHVVLSTSWAIADAWDSLFPHDVHLPAGDLPERSPYLTPAFAKFAMGIPVAERFSDKFDATYHCRKALVVSLFPDYARPLLPTSKDFFSGEFQRYNIEAIGSLERAVSHGLFDPAGVRAASGNAVVLHAAYAVEEWIRGAELVGAKASAG